MRIDLVAQRPQLRILRRLSEAGGLALDLANLARIAEGQIERGPADDEEKPGGSVFGNRLQGKIVLRHIFAHFLDMRFVPQIFRIIDIEHQMVEPGNDDRTGNGGGEGGDDPGGQRFVLELAECKIQQIGNADAKDGHDNAAHRHFALGWPVANRGPQRQNDHIEKPESENRQDCHLMPDRRLVISQFKFSHICSIHPFTPT